MHDSDEDDFLHYFPPEKIKMYKKMNVNGCRTVAILELCQMLHLLKISNMNNHELPWKTAEYIYRMFVELKQNPKK